MPAFRLKESHLENSRINGLLSEVETLTKSELTIIRLGHYKDLADVANKRQAKVLELQKTLVEEEAGREDETLLARLSKLDRQSKEIEQLYKAVIAGVKAARSRLDAIQKQIYRVGTYAEKGKPMHLPSMYSVSEKKV